MLKYEDKLWGKTEFLHNIYRTNYSYYKEFIEFIDKVKKAYSSFSDAISAIFNKKYNIFEDKSTILFSLLSEFKSNIKFQSQEFKELSNIIGKEIIEPFKNSKNININDKSENLYKEFNELLKKVKKSKQNLEEKKNIYYNNMKETEKLIIDEKSMKVNSLTSNQEIKLKQDITYSSVCDSLENEDHYINAIDETNKLINELNLKEKELLNFYQNNEEKLLNKIKNNISFLLAYIKASNSKINIEIDNINQIIVQYQIENGINNFIIKNKSNLLPEKNYEFIPYSPFTNLNNSIRSSSEIEEMTKNYEVIKHLKKFFNKIYENLDMKEEEKRNKLRQLCINIFDKNNQNFVKEDKDELINFMKNIDYRNYFLSALTHQRLNGKFKREEKLFNELLEILNVILELAEKEKNYDNVRNCIILSQTFYKERIDDEGNVEKEYLMEHIKNNKWISTTSFWKDFIEDEIIKDKKKFEEDNEKGGGDVTKIYFSKLITYSHNMNMFGIPKDDVNNIIDYFIKKYEISDTLKEIIISNIEAIYSPHPIEEKKTKNSKNTNKRN
jgi:protein-tyrosine phosphatase